MRLFRTKPIIVFVAAMLAFASCGGDDTTGSAQPSLYVTVEPSTMEAVSTGLSTPLWMVSYKVTLAEIGGLAGAKIVRLDSAFYDNVVGLQRAALNYDENDLRVRFGYNEVEANKEISYP